MGLWAGDNVVTGGYSHNNAQISAMSSVFLNFSTLSFWLY